MKLNKSLIVLLAVFMLILSAGAVSAEGFLVTDDDDESVATDFEDVAGDGDDATGSSSNLSKNPTANPILVLLAAIASVGIASIKRK